MVTTDEAEKYLNQVYETRNNALTVAYQLEEMKQT